MVSDNRRRLNYSQRMIKDYPPPAVADPSQLRVRRALLLALAIVLASATVSYSLAWMYYIRAAITVEVGMDTLSDPEGLKVREVWHGSPAEQAGLRVNDLITEIDGQSTVSPALGMEVVDRIWFASHPGDAVHFTVKRPGDAHTLVISPMFRKPKGAGDTVSIAQRGAAEILRFYPLIFLAVGLPVLFLRLDDRNAWLMALLFAGLIAESPLPTAFVIAPEAFRVFLYGYFTIARSVVPPLFFFFFAVFPTRSPIDRKAGWLKWLLLALGIVLGCGALNRGEPMAMPFVVALLGRHTVGLIRLVLGYGGVSLGLASLLLNVFSVTRREDRRKLKVILWGTLIAVAPALLIGIPYDLRRAEVPFWLEFMRGTFLFLMPLSFGYAVVKHRVMDIPVLLRRSARYFLVERGFAILILLVSMAIPFWFGQAFSRRFSAGSKAAIPIGATLGVLLITGATQVHRQVRTRLDRAFFRSVYDAQQILEHLAARALTVTNRAELGTLLHQQIEEALHPLPLVIYLRSHDRVLQAYAGAPPEQLGTLTAEDVDIAGLAERKDVLELDPARLAGSKLQSLQAECLVPIRGSGDGELQGLAVLGPRLSEEPYSARDRRLLASVASQAGIAMRSISLAETMAQRMEAERRAEQEMQIARQVQSRLLPQQAPVLRTLDCAGRCIQTR